MEQTPKLVRKIVNLFIDFTDSEKAGGLILIACTAVSLFIANSGAGPGYAGFWKQYLGPLSIEHWINDALMAVFFLLVGLELEREIYKGELSSWKDAILPLFAAIGGLLVPALVYSWFNRGTATADGFGIPMATDIAFALGLLSLLGKRVPLSLKIFLTALAVIDDLCAILVIAIFYSSDISWLYLGAAFGIFAILGLLNRLRVYHLLPYLIGGVFLWICFLKSGVHATLSGVLLAFVIPFGDGSANSTSYRLQHRLHKPVAFVVLPLFALANTIIVFDSPLTSLMSQPLGLGISIGLILGKPVGILLAMAIPILFGWGRLPGKLNWFQLIAASFLAGIGFTMSIFISLLAFSEDILINNSKLIVLVSSVAAGLIGLLLLRISLPKPGAEEG